MLSKSFYKLNVLKPLNYFTNKIKDLFNPKSIFFCLVHSLVNSLMIFKLIWINSHMVYINIWLKFFIKYMIILPLFSDLFSNINRCSENQSTLKNGTETVTETSTYWKFYLSNIYAMYSCNLKIYAKWLID